METEQEVPFNVLSDTYNVWVPLEDTELMKSVSVDENGDYIVQGVISSDDMDEEDDSITPEGMDCSYFLTKGWVKYEHGTNPNQFIGEPLDVRVGKFDHPTLKKSVNGIYVKARLFSSREMTKQAVSAIQDLQKSNTKRRMGWSIEGNVKERDRKTGKVLKSILRNVVLTMNPVNTTTWAELAKSFAKHHEVEVDMEGLDKSMDTAAIAEVMPQSLEGATKVQTPDPQDEWITLFRKFVRANALQKAIRNEFTTSTEAECGLRGYTFASQNGLSYDGACEFASYIAERHEILKSLFGKFGGETMSEKAKTAMASMLDADLEELQKSLALEDETEEEDELQKSVDTDESDDSDEDESADEDADASEDDSDDDSDESEEDDESEEEEADESSSELKKSLTDAGHGQAFEVSNVLGALVDELGFGMEGLQKSMSHMTKQQNVIVKSLLSVAQVVQDMTLKVEGLESENAELRKSLDTIAERPVGRKSVVSQRDVQTLQKSVASTGGDAASMTRKQVGDILMKSFEAGELKGSEVARFEGGVRLEQLNLPPSVKNQLGLQ